MRPILSAACCALALAVVPAAAHAQSEPSPAPSEAPPSAAAEKSPEERAIEAKAAALRDGLVRMQDELVAAWPDGDKEAIIAPYRVQADDLAASAEAFLNARAEAATAAETAEALRKEAVENGSKIRAMPDLIARTVLHALANPRPAPEPQPEPQAQPDTPAQ
ncbi:MAG: hypothetical protein DI552_02175 [Brevundimonas sp.]|uniref:hypothetical protein n=1 Tax=Brevundimonas sp. TaxID=1871086 RepID=UPI000DBBD1C6|nr:hypothetical protein [Brevundimonas sp.]PZU61736.1 MAG: hypothetical protein DI552_02175 [Brevundimonas sp.]